MRATLYNTEKTLGALQENVAIAAAQLLNEKQLYIQSPITIEQAFQIGQHLWDMGYRLSGEPKIVMVQV